MSVSVYLAKIHKVVEANTTSVQMSNGGEKKSGFNPILNCCLIVSFLFVQLHFVIFIGYNSEKVCDLHSLGGRLWMSHTQMSSHFKNKYLYCTTFQKSTRL